MRVLTISDTHAPFAHPGALDFLAGLKKEYKPDEVVHLGDEIDGHGWSRHHRHPDAPGQGDELRQAIAWMQELYKLFPKVKVCNSNHNTRAYRTASRAGLPLGYLQATHEVLKAPKTWVWADQWQLDGVLYAHGEGFSGINAARTAAISLRSNVVIGHIHSNAGVQYHSNGVTTVWGMNAGCLVNGASYALEYSKHFVNKQVISTGVVLDKIPHIRLLEAK